MADDDVDLDKIVSQIDDKAVHDKVGQHHQRARENYPLDKFHVDNFDEFRKVMTDFMKHYKKETLGVSDYNDEMAWGEARDMLNMLAERKYGTDFEGLYKQAKEKGKLKDIIDDVSMQLKAQHEQKYKQHVIDQYIPVDDSDKKQKVAEKYIEQWGKHLDDEIKKKPPEELAAKYDELLHGHQELKGRVGGYLEQPQGNYDKAA